MDQAAERKIKCRTKLWPSEKTPVCVQLYVEEQHQERGKGKIKETLNAAEVSVCERQLCDQPLTLQLLFRS